jgi:GDP/UDP-N,N'-diacetylbacillosamine 2-epimerase (hydrolysing)
MNQLKYSMKVCVATGTRAEYGLLKPLISRILAESHFTLQLLVTGAHLSPEFGLTYKQIEEDGLKIDEKVEMLLSSDTSEGITKSMGIGMIGFADALKRLLPDLLIILGDRYEMLALASAAMIFKIPIAHLHGGEITEGAYDDCIRHAITKMSHLHFTSTEQYRQRVIQLGEDPDRVFNVGAIGLDNVKSLALLSKEQLENELNITFQKHNYIVAFHPETLSDITVEEQFNNLLDVIKDQKDSFFIFTKANADTDGRVINALMSSFAAANPEKAVLFSSLGSLKFLSVLKVVDAIVGNSSSGIIEAPSLKTSTINIGDRQKGRIQANSIINCNSDSISIANAFNQVKSELKEQNLNIENPYDKDNTSGQILELIKGINTSLLKVKSFYNIKW